MLARMLSKITDTFPDQTAIVYDRSRISYQQLYHWVGEFSRGLRNLDIEEGDCVAVLLPNCPEFIIAFYAIAKQKAIILPLNPLFKAEEIEGYLQDSQAKVIITDRQRADICYGLREKFNSERKVIVVDANDPEAENFYDLMVADTGEDEADIETYLGNIIYQYSSGTTGMPKRICRTQYNLYHEAKNLAETAHINKADIILCLVPLHHAHGLGNCLLAALSNGATLVILEPVLRGETIVEVPLIFRRNRVLELLETEKVTILPIVPYIVEAIAETPPDINPDLSNLRLCFSAGNFLSKETFVKFLQRWKVPVRQLYGCTEAGSVTINLDEQVENTHDSVGMPMKNVTVTIVDEEGNELPIETKGEVVIKSEALTRGYANLPELNRQVWQNGAFFTGDLGKKDAAGRLYLTGRKKLLIDTGGYKVDPLEIEDVLMSHPQVKEAVVVGVKEIHAGEKVKAVIVPLTQECTSQEILYFCQRKLAKFKIPQIIEFRDKIPKSPLGKILRKDLV